MGMLKMGFHAIGVQHPFGPSLKVKYFWSFVSGGSVAGLVEMGFDVLGVKHPFGPSLTLLRVFLGCRLARW